MQNAAEFVAMAMTNAEFQQTLAGITLTDAQARAASVPGTRSAFRAFVEAVRAQLGEVPPQPEIRSDGALPAPLLTLETAEILRFAGPWGKDFPEPVFDDLFTIRNARIVGERHLKVMVEPVGGGPLLDGIAFNVDTAVWPDNGVREVELAYKLDINEFRGNRTLQIIIDNIWPI